MDTLVTDQMEQTLVRLQTVKPFDFAAAYHAAYGGIHALDPRRNETDAELIYGRSLGLELWSKRQLATSNAQWWGV